jgi:drug/metabolite transporter (DMT)-like permease
MFLWISLSIIAQFINAFVAVIDRYIVASGKVGRPIVLTFYVSLLSALGIFAFAFSWINLPFDSIQLPNILNITWPTWSIVLLSLAAAASFIVALYTLFSAFSLSEASDVVPVVSSISALSSLLFSFYLLDTILSGNFLWGFLFLVIGTFLIAHFRMHRKLVLYCVSSGFLFGFHYVVIKMLFNETNFDNAFFWSRLIIAISALSLLLLPNCCGRNVASDTKHAGKSGLFLVLFNKLLAGIAGILVLKSVELGDVSIVQALSGLQFVFLLIFAIFFGHKAPKCVGENCEARDRVQKIISVSIIVTGFSLLFI